jgi:hypothetical protein
MNETFSGTTTQSRPVLAKASVSMRVNSESISNEIDENDEQFEKHLEQRI